MAAQQVSFMSGLEVPSTSRDWSLCLFCQKNTGYTVVNPGRMDEHGTGGLGYETLEQHLIEFEKIGHLPSTLLKLDEGSGIAATLQKHSAVWHKDCRAKFSSRELSRKRRVTEKTETADTGYVRTKVTRSSSCSSIPKYEEKFPSICCFCDCEDSDLSQAMTMDIDTKVRCAAHELGKEKLIAKLSEGDMVAREWKYHKACLVKLYNEQRTLRRQSLTKDSGQSMAESIVFAQLVTFIEECCEDRLTVPVFRLSELKNLYDEKVKSRGYHSDIHSTRLKDKLLVFIPGLKSLKEGKEVMLTFEENLGPALRSACDANPQNEALILSKAAAIIRQKMFKSSFRPWSFDGSYAESCQIAAVPPSLLALVHMIISGSDMQEKTDRTNQSALTLAQLLLFNSVKHNRSATTLTKASRKLYETPVPLYIGIMIHAKTRKRTIIDKLYELGICASYDRVLKLSADLSAATCDHFKSIGAVCPVTMKKEIFTTAVVDNIDHNPSSTTSTTSFHGTGISLIQHPDHPNDGLIQERQASEPPSTGSSSLPEFYSNMTPVLKLSKPPLPSVAISVDMTNENLSCLDKALAEEKQWLTHVSDAYMIDGVHDLSWSAYHAAHSGAVLVKSCTSMLPLFHEAAHTETMIRHSMDVVQTAIKYLNPAQIPVIACDQPLYALAKKIQWTWKEQYGENKFVIMLGALHIEMAALKALGKLLQGSGWSEMLMEAGILSSGVADSCLKASHVTRTRYVHQVTLAALSHLQQKAYEETPAPKPPFSEWCDDRAKQEPTFFFWSMVMELESLMLALVKSQRLSAFNLLHRGAHRSCTLVFWS